MARPAYSDQERKRIEGEIRRVALELFGELGYRAVSLRAIAKKLGWSAPALYRYYDNKESLLAAIRAEGFVEMQQRLADAAKAAPTGREAAAGAMRAYVQFAAEKPQLYQLMYELDQGTVADLPVVREERQKAFAEAIAIAERILDEAGVTGDANQMAHLMWIGVHGLTALNVASQLDLGQSHEDLIEPVVQMLMHGIQIKEGGHV